MSDVRVRGPGAPRGAAGRAGARPRRARSSERCWRSCSPHRTRARVARPDDRRAVGRGRATEGHRVAAGLRVEPAPGPRARPAAARAGPHPRQPTARLRARRRARTPSTRCASSGPPTGPAGALAAGDAGAPRSPTPNGPGRSGGARCSSTSRTRSSPRRERTRLTERRVGLEQDRAAALLELDRPADAADVAEALVAAHPLREQVWELLMLARYRSGRQADALRAFQDARRVLGEELGLEPGPALRRLEQQILDQDPALDRSSPAPAAAPPVPAPTAAGPRPRPPPAAAGRAGRRARPPDPGARVRGHRVGPRFALVSGEAGIGKTTLVRAAVERSGLAGRLGPQPGAGERRRPVAVAPGRPGPRAGRDGPDPVLAWLTAGAPAGAELGGSSVDRLQIYDAVARLLAARRQRGPGRHRAGGHPLGRRRLAAPPRLPRDRAA